MAGLENLETRYAHSGDISIAYQVFGQGSRDFVFVPGIISNIELSWEEASHAAFLTALGEHFRVIIFDKRGQGMSDPMEGTSSLEERMDDLRAVMDAAGSERAVVMGLSEGGPMSILFATTYPERVAHLVLCGAFACSRHVLDPTAEPTLPQLLENLERNWGREAAVLHYAPSLAEDPEALAWHARFQRLTASPRMMQRLMAANARMDVRAILADVQAPTLIIQRRHDRAVPAERSRYLADHIPGAVLHEIPGQDHLPWVGDFKPIVDVIRHLTGVPEGAPEAPSRKLATALFTDIQNSTGQLSAMGDATWRALLDSHDALARELVADHGGRFVKSTGDGCLAVFDGPSRAIRCSQAMMTALGEIDLVIRAGLHAGEIEPRQDDVTGLAVHTAARILEQAADGEILLSRTVMDLTAGSDLTFEDAGVRQLKGLDGDFPLYRPL